jgi:hypothetical protein
VACNHYTPIASKSYPARDVIWANLPKLPQKVDGDSLSAAVAPNEGAMIKHFWAVRLVLVVAVMVGNSALWGQDPPAAAAPSQQVSELLEQLASDQWAERAKAQEALMKIGPEIRPHLESALERTSDLDVRAALQDVLVQLDRLDQNRPTLVTIKVQEASPESVMEELSRQVGIPIQVWPDTPWQHKKKSITMEMEQQPFWLVMQEFCRQAEVRLQPRDQSGAITLHQGAPEAQGYPQTIHNGSLITARRIGRSHNIDFGRGLQVDTPMSLQVQLLTEPKLRIIRGRSQLEVSEAVDENGLSLISSSRSDHWHAPHWGGWHWELQAPLQYHPQQGKALKSFKGAAQFIVVEQEEHWEVDDLLNVQNVEKILPTVTYKIQDFTRGGDNNYRLRFVIEFDSDRRRLNRDDPLTDYGSVINTMKVLDAAGNAYRRMGGGGGGGGAGPRMTLNYNVTFARAENAPNLREPAKLIWSIPTEIKEVSLPVEFQDLPLP